MFDIRFQYALHTCNAEEQPLSDCSLGRFRARCTAYEMETGKDLLHDAVDALTEEISKVMKITHSLKWMDSMIIASNIRKMSRLELIYTCTSNLVNRMKKSGIEILDGLMHDTEENDRNMRISSAEPANTFFWCGCSKSRPERISKGTGRYAFQRRLDGTLCSIQESITSSIPI